MYGAKSWSLTETPISGNFTLDRKLAADAQERALSAIKILHSTMHLEADWNSKDLKRLKRGIGLSIAAIEFDLLGVIYGEFPDLDDLDDLDDQ
jgi:hypothetical protein